MTLSIKNYIYILITFTFLHSCANISTPTGGPRDTTPPKLSKEKSKPSPNSLNYNNKIIELTFDENITINNIQDQLIISPVEDNKYKYVVKKNKLHLEFEKNLSPNTTYTLNFRESIKDVTEGNTAEVIIPFSTGPSIDSNNISGSTTDLKSNVKLNDILISLYKSGDTLSPLNSKPLYLTKSKNGSFKIDNIKYQNYDIYAIDDKNRNMLYEENEKIAFIKNISLDSVKQTQQQLSFFDNTAPKLRKGKSVNNNFEINFNEGVQDLKIKDSNNKELLYSTQNGKDITIYNNQNYKDSIEVNIEAIDSSANVLNTKTKILFTYDKEIKETPLATEYLPANRKINPDKATINLIFNKPITIDSINKIKIKEDTIISNLAKENIKWKNNTSIEINKNIKAKDSLILYVPKNTFNHFNLSNKADTIKFEIKDERNYGTIAGIINTNNENYIVELLDSKYSLKEKLINPKKIFFQYLEPGQYYLRAITDQNKNQKWDGGNLKESKQPESIIFYKNKIDLRANWEIQDIVFEF